MASQSMNALSKKLTDDESGYADLFARILEIGALIGVDNKKQTEAKTTRENWHEADSVEAKAILATKSPRKPRKTDSVGSVKVETNPDAIITALLQALKTASR